MLKLDNAMVQCGGEYAVRFRGHFPFSIEQMTLILVADD